MFSWQLASDRQNVKQRAYQLRVRKEREELWWDTGGKVKTDPELGCYKGRALYDRYPLPNGPVRMERR